MTGFRAQVCAWTLLAVSMMDAHAAAPDDDASPAQIFIEICVAPDRRPASIHEKLTARGAEVMSSPRPEERGYAMDTARFACSVRLNGEQDCGMVFRGIATDDLLPEIDRLLALTSARVSVVGAETVGVVPGATLIGARLIRQTAAPPITLTVARVGDRVVLLRSERPHL